MVWSRRRRTPRKVCAGVVAILVSVSVVAVVPPVGASASWGVVASPNVGGSGDSSLSGVACTSATFCMAVGAAFAPGRTDWRTLVEQWDGARWSLVASPSPGEHAYLSAVSCTSDSNCTAVGSYGVSPQTARSSQSSRTLIEQWNGRSWSVVASPNHSGADSLFGVSCTSATFCVAVGREVARSLIEQWNGQSWSFVGDPGTAEYNGLSGVSCTSTTFCMAVGASVELWDGWRWSVVANAPSGVALSGVSCTSATECVAVGDVRSEGPYVGPPAAVMEHWNGVSWSSAGLSNWVLTGVWCAAASNCYAVGSNAGALVKWDGTSWSIVAGPNPSHAGAAELIGVSCASETTCFAVGFTSDYVGPKPAEVTTTFVAQGPDATAAPISNEPIVGIAGQGFRGNYWLVASDGGVFSFGGAPYYGSTGARRLNKPIVGMAVTPSGHGYWLVASDGGVFTFGDALYHGSTGATALSAPIVGISLTPEIGHLNFGYRLVASDGTVFNFSDAQQDGSPGALSLQAPIVGMFTPPAGQLYMLAASDGETFGF